MLSSHQLHQVLDARRAYLGSWGIYHDSNWSNQSPKLTEYQINILNGYRVVHMTWEGCLKRKMEWKQIRWGKFHYLPLSSYLCCLDHALYCSFISLNNLYLLLSKISVTRVGYLLIRLCQVDLTGKNTRLDF